MIWNFDIEAAPRGTTVRKNIRSSKTKGVDVTRDIFTPDKVLVAASGRMVMVSYWLPPLGDRPKGRWHGLATDEQPVAWMPFPEFPEGDKT